MEKVKIQDTIFEIKSIFERPPLLEIQFNDFIDISNLDLTSIEVFTEGDMKCREFAEYTTIYKPIDENNIIILSSDGDIYTDPEIIEHTPIPIESYEPTEEELTRQEIQRLKNKLETTDYKIIKCSEYQLVGLDLPYDLQELHEERQAIRDIINELEQQLIV